MIRQPLQLKLELRLLLEVELAAVRVVSGYAVVVVPVDCAAHAETHSMASFLLPHQLRGIVLLFVLLKQAAPSL